jgi:acyl-CoA synthetase (AMP-forming)/AMP-acid ligase II
MQRIINGGRNIIANGCVLVTPLDLQDLFPTFDILMRGRSVVLSSEYNDSGAGKEPEGVGPFLGFFSSGSTGKPKLVWRSWSDLLLETRSMARVRSWLWASPYLPWTFAGVQVALQAWITGGAVISLANLTWEEAWKIACKARCDAISATPTYLDLWIQQEPPGANRIDMKQVTLGGEALRSACGERLRARFPEAQFTVIYASAEWGVLLKTHRVDGWYEQDGLDRRRPGWMVDGGLLMLPTEKGGWGTTGDLVERNERLVRVVGRADRVANVGGTKVNLDEVSRLAELGPCVLRAVALAEANSVTGETVSLHYSVKPGINATEVQVALEAALRKQLPKAAWPRRWVCGDVAPSINGKRRIC